MAPGWTSGSRENLPEVDTMTELFVLHCLAGTSHAVYQWPLLFSPAVSGTPDPIVSTFPLKQIYREKDTAHFFVPPNLDIFTEPKNTHGRILSEVKLWILKLQNKKVIKRSFFLFTKVKMRG